MRHRHTAPSNRWARRTPQPHKSSHTCLHSPPCGAQFWHLSSCAARQTQPQGSAQTNTAAYTFYKCDTGTVLRQNRWAGRTPQPHNSSHTCLHSPLPAAQPLHLSSYAARKPRPQGSAQSNTVLYKCDTGTLLRQTDGPVIPRSLISRATHACTRRCLLHSSGTCLAMLRAKHNHSAQRKQTPHSIHN